MALIAYTNVTLKEIEYHALRIPDAEVDEQPEIKRLKKEIVLAEARLAAASKSAHETGNRTRAVVEAARLAEREIQDIESGQPDLAVEALLGDADARERFAERGKRAEELRALLRWHKLAAIARGRNDEASADAALVKNAADAVDGLEETLAGQRRVAKLAIAKKKLTPC